MNYQLHAMFTFLIAAFDHDAMGQTWQKMPISMPDTPTNAYVNAISFPTVNHGWVAGSQGIIRRTSDAGVSWATSPSGVTSELRTIHFVDTLNGFAAGTAGTILKTVNGGTTWSVTTSSTSSMIYHLQFLTPQVGYAVGVGGTILKTVNGGTWNLQSAAGKNTKLSRVYFLDANQGFAVGDTGAVFRTGDGGAIWSFQSVTVSTPKPHLAGIFFTSPAVGYVVGEYASGTSMNVAFKTTDSGASWSPMTMPTIPQGHMLRLSNVRFMNADTGYIVGNTLSGSTWSGVILRTSNAGQSWAIEFQPVFNVFNLSQSPDDAFYALADSGASRPRLLRMNLQTSSAFRRAPSSSSRVRLWNGRVEYPLAVAGKTRVTLLTPSGRHVGELFNGWQNAGRHSLPVDASGVSPGAYILDLRAGGQRRAIPLTIP